MGGCPCQLRREHASNTAPFAPTMGFLSCQHQQHGMEVYISWKENPREGVGNGFHEHLRCPCVEAWHQPCRGSRWGRDGLLIPFDTTTDSNECGLLVILQVSMITWSCFSALLKLAPGRTATAINSALLTMSTYLLRWPWHVVAGVVLRPGKFSHSCVSVEAKDPRILIVDTGASKDEEERNMLGLRMGWYTHLLTML